MKGFTLAAVVFLVTACGEDSGKMRVKLRFGGDWSHQARKVEPVFGHFFKEAPLQSLPGPPCFAPFMQATVRSPVDFLDERADLFDFRYDPTRIMVAGENPFETYEQDIFVPSGPQRFFAVYGALTESCAVATGAGEKAYFAYGRFGPVDIDAPLVANIPVYVSAMGLSVGANASAITLPSYVPMIRLEFDYSSLGCSTVNNIAIRDAETGFVANVDPATYGTLNANNIWIGPFSPDRSHWVDVNCNSGTSLREFSFGPGGSGSKVFF